jgi:predicted transcriptional regulator
MFRRKTSGLASVFGTLELRVLEVLWQRGTEASVRDVLQEFPQSAYTTVMTTMERLHRKGALLRRKGGRAFLYRPAETREALESSLVASAIEPLLTGASAQPILSCFVEEVSRRDERLLDELERLVQLKRRQNGSGR